MRILIVEDNAALQEALKEVISDADHRTETVSSAEEAFSSVLSFRPDAVFLDIDMQGGQGFMLLDKMQNSSPPIGTPVIIIRSWQRQIPHDISMIRGRIEKPFFTSDILESITKLQIQDTDAVQYTTAVAKRAESVPKTPKRSLTERGITFGTSYVMFQRNSNAVHDLTSAFDNEGYDVLVVTTRKKKEIIGRYRNKELRSLTLKVRLLGGHFNIYGLGTMINDVSEFIKNNSRPVVAFDNLNDIINKNGLNSALAAVHQLVTRKYDKLPTFLVSVDPERFTTKDKEILLSHMIYYDPIGE